MKQLQELIDYYTQLGNQAVSASLVLSELKLLEQPTELKICHRSISGRELRECIGKRCDRYNNCVIAWKRAILDRKTYGIGEPE